MIKLNLFWRMTLVIGLFSVLGFEAGAVDMAKRLGVGIEDPYTFHLPAISIHYYPDNDFGYVGNFGVDTEQNNSKLALGGAIRKNIFKEAHLNFFMQGGIAYESVEIPNATNSDTHTGFEITALMGVEIFPPGMENFGLNILGGAAVSTVNKSRFRTVGLDFLHAGLIFYF